MKKFALATALAAATVATGCGSVDAPAAPGLLGAAVRGQPEHHGKLEVVAPGKSYRGVSQGEWGFRWWQWAYEHDFAHSPIADETGAECATEQDGPVWFLAGTSGVEGVKRSCTIPEHKALFFPLVNYLNDYPCPDPSFKPAPGQSLEDFLTEGAAGVIDLVDTLHAEFDGVPIANLMDHRALSDLGTFKADLSWQAQDPCVTGKKQQGVSDGYYLMLKSVPEGKHTLRFGGGIRPFGFATDVTYNLNVKD